MKISHPDHYIFPEWPAPAHVKAATSFQRSRTEITQDLKLSVEPVWLNQVHGAHIIDLDINAGLTGDATFTQRQNKICVVLTADCLPILITDQAGSFAAALHGGWRGLAGGIIDNAIKIIKKPVQELLVWLGPAIGPDHFEVGEEVREQFLGRGADYSAAFSPKKPGKFMADIYQIAKINCHLLGIKQIFGGGLCTYCDDRFYSYRRDQQIKGHMATLIWLEPGITH